MISKSVSVLDNEKQLVKDCISGNRAMQNKLYSQYAPAMMGMCLRYCRNRHDAEEILQEGFIRVFTCLHQYKFKGSLEGWIKKIMVNCALQRLRNDHLLYKVVYTCTFSEEFIERDFTLNDINTKELILLVQGLPAVCRLVFNLHVFEGMTHHEIARLLNVSEGTSKSNLHDARILLQRRLHEQESFININSGA